MTQSEQALEQNLIQRLTGLGYEPVTIRNAAELAANLKTQLEKHNDTSLSPEEFKRVLNHLDKSNVFDKAERLRDKMELSRDDDTTTYLEFLNIKHWCQNQYQVTHQIAQQYQTQHSAKDSKAFYTYYKDISKRMKDRDRENAQDRDRADILLVVNMFLTGFDVKKLNTLYVDKNLQYHGLIQAYSRTNRILSELKSQGNIVSFRNLKENTDQAVALFSDANANEEVFIEPYEHYIDKFNNGVQDLRAIAAIPNDVNKLIDEDDQMDFVKAFRNLIRVLNVSKSFTEFDFTDLNMDEQTFEDYKSKYLDIYDRTRSPAHSWLTRKISASA